MSDRRYGGDADVAVESGAADGAATPEVLGAGFGVGIVFALLVTACSQRTHLCPQLETIADLRDCSGNSCISQRALNFKP